MAESDKAKAAQGEKKQKAIVPHLRSRRFAWDLELLLLAHRAGKRFVTGPVHVRPAARASRVGWKGALQAGLDTLEARDNYGSPEQREQVRAIYEDGLRMLAADPRLTTH